MTTRRDFFRTTAAGGILGMGWPLDLHASDRESDALRSVEPAPRALRLLILGGTGFTGPHQVRHAVARGHTVTVFNRGRRQANLPDGVEHLVGDRNDDLKSLEGR